MLETEIYILLRKMRVVWNWLVPSPTWRELPSRRYCNWWSRPPLSQPPLRLSLPHSRTCAAQTPAIWPITACVTITMVLPTTPSTPAWLGPPTTTTTRTLHDSLPIVDLPRRGAQRRAYERDVRYDSLYYSLHYSLSYNLYYRLQPLL